VTSYHYPVHKVGNIIVLASHSFLAKIETVLISNSALMRVGILAEC